MAGYRKSGINEFVNATTFNDQIVLQRNAYRDRNQSEMGIGSVSSVFPDRSAEVFADSVAVMNSLDITYENGNPDFIAALDFANNKSASMYDDLGNAKDKPNKKGPNLIAPDINNITSPTQNQATIPDDRQNKGFGWRDDRNEPSTPAATIGTYFSRHYNATESANPNKPVLGEAKNPDVDNFINYEQE